jgi:hypothetical protein
MPQTNGAKTGDLRLTFAALRESLAVHRESLLVTVDKPGDYQLCSRTLKDRMGRPLFVAGIQIKKNYVSYHLLPIYMAPALQKKIPPALKKRMQGKACFNFTTIESQQIKELAALTRRGIEVFNDIKLPWEKPAKR